MQVDYDAAGLKVGLEIHRQLDTKHKLFCGCPTGLSEAEPSSRFKRRLRPTQSEMGQVDTAALFEFRKGRTIEYEASPEATCLVEMDEEPPGSLNQEAVRVGLTMAALADAKPVDEVHVMRKLVIDGSNTTGFQRTCVIAMEGSLRVGDKAIPIQQISVEEDAARKTGGSGNVVNYRLDRLGIPLIEVTTGPVIFSPTEAEEVALAIGSLLKSTRKVNRGLGSIRQDLNISIKDGALIEIKGVQELQLLSKVVECEVKRQLGLLEIRRELKARSGRKEDISSQFVDVSLLFNETKCKVIAKTQAAKGVTKACVLKKFGGLLKRELCPGLRLGTEMAGRAAFWGGVGGIFHSDELPAYGIDQSELAAVASMLGAQPDDAFVLVSDQESNVNDALNAVVERAREALDGVPEETRVALQDGTTCYMRPRPGAARMYPETDVPAFTISEALWTEVKATLPPPLRVQIQTLQKAYSINEKLASQLCDSDYLSLFEKLAATTKLAPSFLATTLTETMKALSRDGIPVDLLSDESVKEAFMAIDRGVASKEAITQILSTAAKQPTVPISTLLGELGLRMLSEEELRKVVDRHIEKNMSLIKERGDKSLGSLIGSVMSEVRGVAAPEKVQELVKKRVAVLLKS